MSLATARVQSFLSVQIIVWMAKQSVRMIPPVVKSLIKIIIKVKTKMDVMAIVLWRTLNAAVMESIVVLMDTLVKQMENASGESKSEDSLESKLWLLMEVIKAN